MLSAVLCLRQEIMSIVGSESRVPVQIIGGRQRFVELSMSGAHSAVDSAESIREERAAFHQNVTTASDNETIFTVRSNDRLAQCETWLQVNSYRQGTSYRKCYD